MDDSPGRRLNRPVVVAALSGITILALTCAAVSVTVGSSSGPERDGSGRITGSGMIPVTSLHVGDCFVGFRETAPHAKVMALPCSRPHDGELVEQKRLPDGPYPGAQKMIFDATEACKGWHKRFEKTRLPGSFTGYTSEPDRESWQNGKRDVRCLLRYTGPEPLRAPLETTLDPSLRTLAELRPGDCISDWRGFVALAPTVACFEPHRHEVLAVHRLPAGPYPGEVPVERMAGAGCRRLMLAAFRTNPPPVELLGGFVPPNSQVWDEGTHKAVCVVTAKKGLLHRSVTPG